MAPAATTGAGIQRTIHQVWLGSNPRPEEWMKTVRDFATEHGYEYRLWDEAAAAKLPWDTVPGLRALYREFDKELAGKADLIRLLAIYKHGGLYIDADSVMMKPAKFASFLEKNRHPVFFAWEEIKKGTKGVDNFGPELQGRRGERLIANGTIGAEAGHPFLKAMIDGIVEHATVRERGAHAWRRVGPLYVTRVYWAQKDKGAAAADDVHMYPMKLFYPRHWRGIKDPELHKKVRIPGESMLFQYGYSTNNFADIFRKRAKRTRRAGRGRSRAQTRRH
jgi:mannosyltransferase OCH1-like enzyme